MPPSNEPDLRVANGAHLRACHPNCGKPTHWRCDGGPHLCRTTSVSHGRRPPPTLENSPGRTTATRWLHALVSAWGRQLAHSCRILLATLLTSESGSRMIAHDRTKGRKRGGWYMGASKGNILPLYELLFSGILHSSFCLLHSPGGRSHIVHNEQAKCYRTWQGRITFWGRRKLRPAILWYSLLLVSGCSRTGSIEVTWKNCCHARLGESTQLRLTVSPVRRHNRSDVTVIGKGLQGRLGHGVGCVLILRGFPACNLGPGCGGCQRDVSRAG